MAKKIANKEHLNCLVRFIEDSYKIVRRNFLQQNLRGLNIDSFISKSDSELTHLVDAFLYKIRNYYFLESQLQKELEECSNNWIRAFLCRHGCMEIRDLRLESPESLKTSTSPPIVSASLLPFQSFQTSGARGITLFELNGEKYIAIPQLARDMPQYPADMNGGDGAARSIIYRWNKESDSFVIHQILPTEGAEAIDVKEFQGQFFLVIAQIRSGISPDFKYKDHSLVYLWDGNRFKIHQRIATFAAKNACFFEENNKLYLLFNEGVYFPDQSKDIDTSSGLYLLEQGQFVLSQRIPGKWGYEGNIFRDQGLTYLSISDHVGPSSIYRYESDKFTLHQEVSNEVRAIA